LSEHRIFVCCAILAFFSPQFVIFSAMRRAKLHETTIFHNTLNASEAPEIKLLQSS